MHLVDGQPNPSGRIVRFGLWAQLFPTQSIARQLLVFVPKAHLELPFFGRGRFSGEVWGRLLCSWRTYLVGVHGGMGHT